MENDINQFIENKGIKRTGIILFTPENAQSLIKLLVLNNKQIYGVDGIFILKEGYRPSLDNSIDTGNRYKNNASVVQVGMELQKFIEERANIDALFFEVVFQK